MTIKQHGGVFGRNPSFNDISVETLSIAGTALSSTAAELNILDGVTADATELNYLDGASTSAVVSSKAVVANSSGNIAFPNGKGIDFSATGDGSGSVTDELLDEYEEGTFSPDLVSTGGGETITYTYNTGSYTRVGRTVYINAFIKVASVSGGSGNARISGPFTALNRANFLDFNVMVTLLSGGSLVSAGTVANTSNINTGEAWANVSPNDEIRISGTFEAA